MDRLERERERRRRRDRHRDPEERRTSVRDAGSSVSLSSSSMAIKLWKCYKSRISSGVDDEEYPFDNIIDMLDPDLRPVPPDMSCPDSRKVYEDHKKLAQDYLKLQEELSLSTAKKKQLEDRVNRIAMGRENRDTAKYVTELVQLQEENESLRKLHRTLLAERDALTRPSQERASSETGSGGGDGWVMVHRT